jgi:Fe-S-cluster containining protein
MSFSITTFKSIPKKQTRFLKQLKSIYAVMDRKYREAADYYGFHCTGCGNNCCFTRFYHHTLLEYLYLREGFQALAPKMKNEIKQRASEVCGTTAAADIQAPPLRLMCPLNFDGLCRLYGFRPMICRLHGLPHELRQPGKDIVHHPGCADFTAQCFEKEYFKFDRTFFFIEMAALEQELRQAVGIIQKIKMSVAEMLTTF